MSASDVSKPIFEIKATEDSNNISTPMLSVSVKKVLYFGYLAVGSSPKISAGGFGKWLLILPSHLKEIQAKRV